MSIKELSNEAPNGPMARAMLMGRSGYCDRDVATLIAWWLHGHIRQSHPDEPMGDVLASTMETIVEHWIAQLPPECKALGEAIAKTFSEDLVRMDSIYMMYKGIRSMPTHVQTPPAAR